MKIKTKMFLCWSSSNTIPLLKLKYIVYSNKPELSTVSYQISKQNVLVYTWERQLDCCTWKWLLIWMEASAPDPLFLSGENGREFFWSLSILYSLFSWHWYSPTVSQFYPSWCYYSLYQEGRFLIITTLININVQCYFHQFFKQMRT